MISEKQKEALFVCARSAYALGESKLRSFSGADRADSEVHFLERGVYVAVAEGTDVETAIATADARWRAYAAERARKVSAAPKIKRGPRSGQSSIDHTWVDPELFTSKARHIRFMIARAIGEGAGS